MKTAIRVDSLSKFYRLGSRQSGPYRTLRETLATASAAPVRAFRRLLGKRPEIAHPTTTDFWALKDVSFEIEPGEVVGIIGRNGAGKSTLLKILSRITEPTKGRVEVRGRMASLLEVGTGFHPELSGRENIYLNGAILGMTRNDIKRNFDAIVAFSEIDQFLDTPVKHYSSGMYIRLAFAVAAHLETDLLIVDEVLAVGDAGFQKKCLGKMTEVAHAGKTVLFVSHNMQAVTGLCSRAILLRQGQLDYQGDPLSVVENYLGSEADQVAHANWDLDSAPGNDMAKLRSVTVLNDEGEPSFNQDITKPISVAVEFWLRKPSIAIDASIHVLNGQGVCLFAVGATHKPTNSQRPEPGLYRAVCRIPAHFFNDGKHYVSAFVVRNHNDIVVNAKEVVSFIAHDYGTHRGGWLGKIIGEVRPVFPWDFDLIGGLR